MDFEAISFNLIVEYIPKIQTMLEEWAAPNPHSLGVVRTALRVLHTLKQWSAEHFGSVRKELESLRCQLTDQQTRGMDSSIINETIHKMNETLYREEMLWLQRLRVAWDKDTKFFHQQAAWRARKNKIHKLKQDDGSWTSNIETMHGMVNNYFKN